MTIRIQLFALLLLFGCYSNVFSQTGHYKREYNEGTKILKKIYDSTDVFKDVHYFINVDYRIYYNDKDVDCYRDKGLNCSAIKTSDKYINHNTIDSLMSFKNPEVEPIFYRYYYKNDKTLKEFCNSFFDKKRRRYSDMGGDRVHFPLQDSLSIISQFKNITNQFKANEIKTINLPESLNQLLKKYTKDTFVYMDVLLFTDDKISHYQSMNCIGVYRMYIVNTLTGQINFYSYETSFDSIGTGGFGVDWFSGVYESYKKLLRRSKYYFEDNKKFLNEHKKGKRK